MGYGTERSARGGVLRPTNSLAANSCGASSPVLPVTVRPCLLPHRWFRERHIREGSEGTPLSGPVDRGDTSGGPLSLSAPPATVLCRRSLR